MKLKKLPALSTLVGGTQVCREGTQALSEVTGAAIVFRPMDIARRGEWDCRLLGQPSCECRTCAPWVAKHRLRQTLEAGPKTTLCGCGSLVPVRSGAEWIAVLQMAPNSLPAPRRRAALILVRLLGDRLTDLSHQVLIQRGGTEPEMVTKAKAYVLQHLAGDLSLGVLAAALHVSRSHLSRLFQRSTGVKVTTFISRVRIERVKLLLLKPALRVSEAAFQAGFQSITQFNRAFRHHTGKSPTSHRRGQLRG